MLVGTAAGLLLPTPIVACVATIAVPLGVWAALRPFGLHEWLTPAGSLPYLLTGDMDSIAWVRWLAVLVVWGVGLNVAGLWWRRRAATTKTGARGVPPRRGH
jgi:hypothetical protein